MAPTPLLVKDKPNDAGVRQPAVNAQSRRRWRLVRRAVVLVLGFVGTWMFWVDRFWVNRLQDKFLDRPSSLPMSVTEKARMHELADLMLDIYKTLSEMRYLDPEGIITGPHNLSHHQHIFEALGLDPSIVYLYSILPYVDFDIVGQEDFFQGGRFVDYREEEDVEEGRDPFYANPEGTDFGATDGPYMRAWMTPLSLIGNHQSVIIYDARKHVIWIIDQENWSSSDPTFESVAERPSPSGNLNAFQHIHSRSAPDVLKDINSWYRSLEILPGGEHSGGEWDHFDMNLTTLYRQNGWAENFRGDDFQADQVRKNCANTAKNHAEEPLMKVSSIERWIEHIDEQAEWLKEQMMGSESEDDQWRMRFEIWRDSRYRERALHTLRQAKEAADKYCPNGICLKSEDLPLWEFDCVKEEHARAKMEYQDEEENANNEMDPAVLRASKKLTIYSNALAASKAAADRIRPGAGLDVPPRGRDDIRKISDMTDQDVVGMKQFLSTVPKHAAKARSLIEREIKELVEQLDKDKV